MTTSSPADTKIETLYESPERISVYKRYPSTFAKAAHSDLCQKMSLQLVPAQGKTNPAFKMTVVLHSGHQDYQPLIDTLRAQAPSINISKMDDIPLTIVSISGADNIAKVRETLTAEPAIDNGYVDALDLGIAHLEATAQKLTSNHDAGAYQGYVPPAQR